MSNENQYKNLEKLSDDELFKLLELPESELTQKIGEEAFNKLMQDEELGPLYLELQEANEEEDVSDEMSDEALDEFLADDPELAKEIEENIKELKKEFPDMYKDK